MPHDNLYGPGQARLQGSTIEFRLKCNGNLLKDNVASAQHYILFVTQTLAEEY